METVNSLLAVKKCDLGYGKMKDVSEFSFIKDIYQSAVEHHSREIKKLIINQSNEYRLNENAPYLHVSLQTLDMWQETEIQTFRTFKAEKVYLVAGRSSKFPYKLTVTEEGW